MIPQEFVKKYDHQEKSHNGYIYERVTKGMYGLPQSVQIENDTLVKHAEPYGYHPRIKTLVVWTHNNQPIRFTLVVDDFEVKYLGKEHA